MQYEEDKPVAVYAQGTPTKTQLDHCLQERILLIDGKPVDYCLARIPKAGETRGNLAAGGRGEARPLSARDREIAEELGPKLAAQGLLLVGLDVIGDCLTEINVTSPTCFREIMDQTGCDVAGRFVEALEARCNA